MYARRSRFGGQLLYFRFHLVFVVHHKVGKLVDNQHDSGQSFGKIRVDDGIVAGNVPHTRFAENDVSAFHFVNHPLQSLQSLFIFADDFVNKKMRQSFIGCKLHLFGVNKDKPQLFGRIFVKQTDYDAVETYTFSAACGTRNHEVRHIRKVRHDLSSRNIYADDKGQSAFCLPKLVAVYHDSDRHLHAF